MLRENVQIDIQSRFKCIFCEKIAKIALKSKNNMIFACFLTVWMEASRRHFQTACLYPLLFLRQINSNLNLLLTVADYQHIRQICIRILIVSASCQQITSKLNYAQRGMRLRCQNGLFVSAMMPNT